MSTSCCPFASDKGKIRKIYPHQQGRVHASTLKSKKFFRLHKSIKQKVFDTYNGTLSQGFFKQLDLFGPGNYLPTFYCMMKRLKLRKVDH